MVKRKCVLSLGGLVLMTVLAGEYLRLSFVFADDVVDEINITVPVSCSFAETVDDDNTYTATISNNDYEDDIGHTTFQVFCNDNNGYSIYAVGYSGNTFGNTEMLYTGNSSPAPNNIVTGTATSGSTSNWAMKMTAVAGTYAPTLVNGFGSYRTVPNTYTKVATFPSQTDNTTGSSVQSSYAVFVSATQGAGTYEGKVRYTLVHPNDADAPLQPQTTQAGQICYYPNGSNVEGTMGCQTVSTSETSATLLASNFSRAGYGFAGWSKTFDYSDDTGFLGPQETITFTAGQYTGSNPGLSLYARWIKSAGSLQGWTGCSSLQSGAVTALTDQRDNNTYAIAKLADGKCWMIENLRLENTGTDNTNGSLAQGYNTSFAGLADPEAASLFTSTATANTLYSTDGSTEKTISGSSQGYRFPRYNNVNTPTTATDRPINPTTNSSTNSTSNAGMYSYGNYYTWAAAIADTTNYTTDNQSVTNTSICPTGWHLPQGGDKTRIESNDDNDFWNLTVDTLNGGTNPANYDSKTRPYYTGTAEASPVADKLRSYPNNFVYSGYVSSGSVDVRGSYGYYWSSTANSSYYAYYLYLNSSYVFPGTSINYKFYGRTVRCVAPSS